MIHPRSLQLDEPRPRAVIWVCTDHGELPAGETTCARCLACPDEVEE